MPKLSSDVARQVEEEAEKGGPQPIPEGIYLARLFEVEVSDKVGDSGYHYWIWKFRIEEEGYKGREQWTNTSLSPKAAFAVGGMFKAFGVPADTHTDELLGRLAYLKVNQQVIAKGPRAGEMGNNVQYAMPYEEGSENTPLDGDRNTVSPDEDF